MSIRIMELRSISIVPGDPMAGTNSIVSFLVIGRSFSPLVESNPAAHFSVKIVDVLGGGAPRVGNVDLLKKLGNLSEDSRREAVLVRASFSPLGGPGGGGTDELEVTVTPGIGLPPDDTHSTFLDCQVP